jgi:adenylate kinase family enzyme
VAAERLARIAVIGSSCAGTTTLARSLSQALAVRHTELDVLYWGPNWTPRPPEEFRSAVRAAVEERCWVIDGNYAAVRDLVWGRATTLVWLDYPFALVFSRALWRSFRRIVSREPLFASNRETLRSITERDWIPRWVLRTFWRRRREYPLLFRKPQFAHLQLLQFRRPAEAERFLRSCTVEAREPW